MPYDLLRGLELWLDASDLSQLGYGAAVTAWPDRTGKCTVDQPTGTAQPIYLPWSTTAGNYLRLPGVSGNYASTPNSASVPDATLDIVACIAPTVWASDMPIIAQGGVNNTRKFQFRLLTSAGSRRLRLGMYADGTNASSADLDTDLPFTAGSGWVRVTRDATTGNITFYYSTDPEKTRPEDVTWTQIGAVVSGVTGALFDSPNTVRVGMQDISQTYFTGQIFFVGLSDTIGGPFVLSFDPSLGNGNSTTIGAATGETWTINRTGSDPAMIVSYPQVLFRTDDWLNVTGNMNMARNKSGFTMFALLCANAVSGATSFFITGTGAQATFARTALFYAITPERYGVGGRRLDADSFTLIATAGPESAVYAHNVRAGRLRFSDALAAQFLNGSVLGTESSFLTAGNTQDTAAQRIRIGANLQNTPAEYFSGAAGAVLAYSRALSYAEQLAIARYYAARTGGAIVIP